MFNKHRLWSRLTVLLLISFFIAACDGDDGAAGADGADGSAGPAGPPGPPGPQGEGIDPVAAAKPESCATCHGGVGEEKHQSIYDQFTDPNTLAVEITSFTSVVNGADFDVTLQFNVTQDGAPYIDPVGMSPSVESQSYYIAEYDSGTGEFYNPAGGFAASLSPANAASNGDGTYTLTQTLTYDPLAMAGGALVAKLADGRLDIEDRQAGKRVAMYSETATDSFDIGDIAAYDSVANVQACIDCHGAPYRKHGNIDAMVAGVPDFTHCKACHNDSSSGGHEEWQHMVDSPLAWATGVPLTPEEEVLYAYDRTLVNDVHMSHAMEFPYPQSMANCNTCHENKLAQILDNSNFTPETCQSCHPIRGIDAWPGEAYAQSHRAPAFEYLWTQAGVEGFHDVVTAPNCQACHGAGVAPAFDEYHSGYDAEISNDAGERYADLYTVSIDDVSLAGDLLTITYSASDPAIVPEVLVSFYGWDSKNFIIPSHTRDGSDLCPSSRGDGCRFEYEAGDTSPLFTSFQEVAPGSWVLTADMAAFVPVLTDDIPTMIANGDIKKAEITLTPELTLTIGGEDVDVALDAVTQTVDIVAGGLVANYFKGTDAVVDITKCNACHDQLAVTFHSGSGRGGDIVACRNCHNPTFTGSHLEMASRSIENYVHAIHSFQDFDPGSTFATFDEVDATRYNLHIGHVFPNFTIKNCEGCHNPGTYNVPDQSKTMPGVLSVSDNPATWYEMVGGLAVEKPAGRNISGSVPEFVTGPASRACGACHRADLINPDLAGDLASFNAHTEAGGTFVENDAEDTVLFGVIDKIMSLFE